jgi:hypothetical protein
MARASHLLLVTGVLPDSLKLKMLAALARGDTAGAIVLWQAHHGTQTVPRALQYLKQIHHAGDLILKTVTSP